MELSQLSIFAAVARHKSFSEAARRLYISHSSASRAVSALEKELGVRLVERNNHVTSLTGAGEALLEEAEKLLAAAEEAAERVKAAAEDAEQT